MTPIFANTWHVAQSFSRTAILLAALLVLGFSPLGFIAVPGIGQAITLLNIPVILGATLEGPLAAILLGAVFGAIAGFKFGFPPLALAILARVIAGLAAALTFQALLRSSRRDSSVTFASIGAVVAGTGTNTLLMTLLALLLSSASPEELLSVAMLHGIVELGMAFVVVVPMTIALARRPA